MARAAIVVALALLCGCSNSHGSGPDAGPIPDGFSGDAAQCANEAHWSVVPAPVSGDLLSITGSGPSDVWIASLVSLWHSDGSDWSQVSLPNLTAPNSAAVWSGAPNDLWFSAAEVKCCVWHWSGQSWTSYPLNDNRQVYSLWGTSPNDVWGIESGDGARPGYSGNWNGSTWTHVDSIAGGALWGSGPGDIWAFGNGAVHWTGGPIWVSGPTLASPKLAVWGSAQDDVWAVGAGSAIHFDGVAWSAEQALPTTAPLRGVWGSCAQDVWAVGDGGAILHFDGSAWTTAVSPTTATLRAIWGVGAIAFAVGDGATILSLTP